MTKDEPSYAHAPLCAALAEEIRGIRDLVECLAGTIVADVRFATDYLEQCQLFDLIVQHADESARMLDQMAEGMPLAEAIDNIRLTAIQDRLRTAALRK